MDFWVEHGLIFLLGLAFFPRITVFFFSAVTGGFLFWTGFLFFPRIYIAIIAILNYWDTNPVLCVIALLMAISGESAEKKAACNCARR
jgi:hypothetical protein